MSTTSPTSSPSVSNTLDFLRLIGSLKTTKRTGWVRNQVSLPESISDHMYRMSLIALTLPTPTNRDKLIRMALVHDLAECIVGDITPHDNVSKQQKRKLEDDAMRHIRDNVLNGSDIGLELYRLWAEYELGQTDDAKLVKEIDKFEMILQADEYERHQTVHLQQFFDSTQDCFHTPFLTALDKQLRTTRQHRLSESTPSTHP
ncbi:HD domain-containing protein 2-like [Gracilariopsis chorda]|uniref:5'-deoxynucleotidase n=1 Tax=Gracilariopsis chorda TaxID=448386 RepID=A0A2V3IWD8_9FLOR|nr:HD domain-containing protein 2-like [Gracilariopsis chorda]|eukprot:PXF46421.1 HD domain-containing protein 2-like [Gracilariopsis chorda]